ncbi:MAG: hypothetical protein HAW63_04745 [Bdellovibrionaceae bacterium]|nr:hypothetical protein [Pseudobdellovibrionaceae bacterium]
MPKAKQNKSLFFILLLFFIVLLAIVFVKKEFIYSFKKSIFQKKLFFAKVINFKGYVLINNTLITPSKNTFYKNILVQTGNGSSAKLYFSTKESIEIYPNSHILIKKLKKQNLSIILKKGNFKVRSKKINSKSTVIYNNNLVLLSKWKTKPQLKKSIQLVTHSNILKKSPINNLITQKKTEEPFFHLIKKYKKYFLYCQANALRKNIKPTGKMLVNLHIINAKIIETSIISSNLNTYLQRCALSVFKKMHFSFSKSKNFWIRYPLHFR